MQIQYFKATKRTNRFRENQKVWVRMTFDNYVEVWFKWRGGGRYVSGMIDRWSSTIGEIKTIDVDEGFGCRVRGPHN